MPCGYGSFAQGAHRWIETHPCTEFWFLLHFLPQISTKHYETYEDVLPDLQRYMPGYEKTARYFKKNNLYKYLTENGDLQRAIDYAEELTRLSEATPEDNMAYSQMHLVFNLIASMDEEDGDKNEQKAENKNRNEENRRQITSDSSHQEPVITSNNSWKKVFLR